MFVVRYKELLLFIMSVGYAELYKCKVSIISVFGVSVCTHKDSKIFILNK